MKRKSNRMKAVWQIRCLNIAKHFYHVYLKMRIPAYVLTWQFPGCQHRWAGGDNFCIIGFGHLGLILASGKRFGSCVFNHVLDTWGIACSFLTVADEIKPFRKLCMIQRG